MVGASIAELLACRAFARPPLWGRIAPGVRRLLGEAAPLFAFSIGMRLFERIDLFLVEALGGSPADAGWYGAALNLAQAPNLFTLAFAPLLLSSLTRLEAAGEVEAVAAAGARGASGAPAALLPMAGLAAGSAPEVVSTVFGTGFGPAAPAALLADLRHDGLMTLTIAAVVLMAWGRAGRAAWISALMVAAADGRPPGDGAGVRADRGCDGHDRGSRGRCVDGNPGGQPARRRPARRDADSRRRALRRHLGLRPGLARPRRPAGVQAGDPRGRRPIAYWLAGRMDRGRDDVPSRRDRSPGRAAKPTPGDFHDRSDAPLLDRDPDLRPARPLSACLEANVRARLPADRFEVILVDGWQP